MSNHVAAAEQAGPQRNRSELAGCKSTMKAVVTTGNGGDDKLVYCDVPTPQLMPGEVLLQVLAAGVNNTEISIRLGWYSNSVTTDTASAAVAEDKEAVAKNDGGVECRDATPLYPRHRLLRSRCCGWSGR